MAKFPPRRRNVSRSAATPNIHTVDTASINESEMPTKPSYAEVTHGCSNQKSQKHNPLNSSESNDLCNITKMLNQIVQQLIAVTNLLTNLKPSKSNSIP